MEILKDTLPKVIFYHPAPLTSVTSAVWKKNKVLQTPDLVTTINGEQTEVTIPYQSQEAEIEVLWTFNVDGSGSFTKSDKFSVTTPYLSIREIKIIVPDITTDEAIILEAGTRHIINAHTGQTFGTNTGTKVAVGDGSQGLFLPARLLNVTAFNGANGLPTRWAVAGDGWYINRVGYGYYDVRSDATEGVITSPYNSVNGFPRGSKYQITGTWGWESIPEPIVAAMRILVNDYACGDSAYRDRYLVSMTAADWRIQFSSGAYQKTGNVKADQLLNEYVMKRGWSVL